MTGTTQTDGASADNVAASTTFPKLLLERADVHADRHAIREKDLGIWQTWTWRQVESEVRSLACGLASRGLQRGDKIAIIGDNRPQLYWSMCAAQCLGGVPVPMYQDSVADELAYVLDHAEARFAVAEDQEQVDKLLEIRSRCPHLELIIYKDARGMRNYGESCLVSFEEIQTEGRAFDAANEGHYLQRVAEGRGSEVAIILYTSGTTGKPKGVVLTHDNVIITARNGVERDGLRPDDEIVAYLPMAWVGDNIFSYGQAYVTGFCVSCPESSATVLNDLREIGPTYFFAPPRIYENLLTSVMVRMQDASRLKQKVFDYFLGVAREVGIKILERRAVTLGQRLRYALGNLLLYEPLKNSLGFSRIRIAYTAGEAIGPDIFDFYRSLGINIKQLYGQTEAAVFVTMQPDGEIKPDSVGTPAPGVEIKIAPDGEVMYRGPGVFHSYYKNPDATAETKTKDGWVHTGDAGFFDDDGHLKIIDRAKDVGRLNDGSMFAPKYLENKLKYFPQIREAVVFGDGRDYVGAFVNIDLEAVGSWAERKNLSYASYQELASTPEVRDLVAECIATVNRDLAQDAQLSGSQIKRFLILPKELDADDGELTRTRKVRRNVVAERYGELVDALYADRRHCAMDTTVTFEDGRVSKIRARVEIHDTQPIPPLARAS